MTDDLKFKPIKNDDNQSAESGPVVSNIANDASASAVTPEQQAIIRRVMSESAEWDTITEESMHDFSLANNPLNLDVNFPEAWKEQVEKRYAFRWCERTDKRVDELTRGGHPVTRWKICTRTTTPFLSKYVDPVLGCITRLDQILLFRPWDRHMVEKNAKLRYADMKAASGSPESVAGRLAREGVEIGTGPNYGITSRDVVEYEEDSGDDVGGLVAE